MSGEVPDIVAPGTRLLFVGINPGTRSGALGRHFAHPGNRFWPALHLAGITPVLLDPAEQHRLADHGVGITNLSARTTARASELTPAELREGGRRLERLVDDLRPAVVAVLGITAYRAAFGQPKATAGRQDDRPGPAQWWVLHNPSGLNAHVRLADLAGAFREVARAAGLEDRTRPEA